MEYPTYTPDPVGPSFTDRNLMIITKSERAVCRFFFSSRKLSMASSIFAPLFPDEASHKKRYQISLDDNNPDITRTLFELCHFERIVPMHPPSLEGASLFAASSRRYGLVNLMAPWVMTWTSSLYDNDKLDFSKGDDLIAWLNICLIFRQEEMFRKITRRAIITATAESLNLAVPIESPFKEIIGSFNHQLLQT
jgi:hypothetical protein